MISGGSNSEFRVKEGEEMDFGQVLMYLGM